MSKLKDLLLNASRRSVVMFFMLFVSNSMLWAQEMNEKFSTTTRMFLNEIREQAVQPNNGPRRAQSRQTPTGMQMPKYHRLIASPDTVGGVAYIPCFIHLKNIKDLSQVRSLGVEVEETFDGLDFVTARVPVKELEALADINNVTRIKVAKRMRPLTDAARQKTNTDDVLTLSPDAITGGITSMYDGTGVVLGIIDTGIDFQHIAFKDKDGNSRIKRAYVYNGNTAKEYSSISNTSPTTDDKAEDHGTHTASTAGGSSVIVNGSDVTVTDDHANATFGGMAPGADLYLAGIKNLNDTYLMNAISKMVRYANAMNKPLVVSNSWGSGWGPHDGTGELADLVGQYFGDNHPNNIILFAASNDAGRHTGNDKGGFFVQKSSASKSAPLGTIIRTNGQGGEYYVGMLASAWSSSRLNCKLYVLGNNGAIKKSWTVTQDTYSFNGLSTYYDGSLSVYIEQEDGKYHLSVSADYGLETMSNGAYNLAIEVYPATGNADVNMWGGDYSYFTNHLTTSEHTWTRGTDDMSVSDEATIPDAIAVGAYVSKTNVKNYQGTNISYYYSGTLNDIANFSSYAISSLSPSGEVLPWITAPGSQVVSGVNHYHTASVDEYSYFHEYNSGILVVNNTKYPYGVMEGTSMSTPVAAGIVALWLQAAQSVGKDLTVNDVKDIMEKTAINDYFTSTGSSASHFGMGKIDAMAGIQYILDTPAPVTESYDLVTDVNTLEEGDKIIITYTDDEDIYVLSTSQQTNNRSAKKDVKVNQDGTLRPGFTAQVITLEKDGDYYLFNVGNGYLYAGSSGSNILKTEDVADDNAKAEISISNGDATIVFQGENTRNQMCFNLNRGNPIFSCYAGSSSAALLPQIYRAVTPAPSIVLNNDGTGNAEVIMENDGKKVNATLADRTFYKDGAWNTICLPFDVTLAKSPLADADVRTMSSASFENGTLTLNFTTEGEVTDIVAGTPYIIRWTSGSDIINPVFEGVTISSANNDFISVDANVHFVGTYDYISFDAENKNIRFMGATNKLYYPLVGARIGAFRSYFQLENESLVKQIVLNIDGKDDTDGIVSIQNSKIKIQNDEDWYDLSGRKMVNGKLPKGIYIRGGRKQVIK